MLDKTTQERLLVQLKKAYYAGVLRVRYGDTDITYQSMSEMKKGIRDLEGSLGLKNSSLSFVQFDFEKGL